MNINSSVVSNVRLSSRRCRERVRRRRWIQLGTAVAEEHPIAALRLFPDGGSGGELVEVR